MEFEWIVKFKRKVPREACSGGLFYKETKATPPISNY